MTAAAKGAVYKAVEVMMGLRELATYVPVDTRAVCPQCNEKRCVMLSIVPGTVAGRTPAPYQVCGACWIEENG